MFELFESVALNLNFQVLIERHIYPGGVLWAITSMYTRIEVLLNRSILNKTWNFHVGSPDMRGA